MVPVVRMVTQRCVPGTRTACCTVEVTTCVYQYTHYLLNLLVVDLNLDLETEREVDLLNLVHTRSTAVCTHTAVII